MARTPSASGPAPSDPRSQDDLRRENERLRAELYEFRRAEASMRDTEQRLRAVVEHAPIVVFTLDRAGTFTLSEGRGLTALGLSPGQVVGMSAFEIYKEFPHICDNLRRCMSGEMVNDIVTVGDLVFESLYTPRRDAQGAVDGVSGVAWDVTQRVRAEEAAQALEEKLAQTQRIETIGTLAGGIAHDFNNILSPIIGYTEIALDVLDAKNPARDDLLQVMKAAQRARELVQQILIFARGGTQEKRPVQLHLVIQEALKLIRSSLPSTIEISQRIVNRDDLVLADPAHMHQVIMNLCTNAAHAMRARGGVLRVELESADAPGAPTGREVVLTVRDQGEGMDPVRLSRVFEPFFTTKPAGEGTGLGLSVVHGIVHAHGGTITAESEPGRGSVFRVAFPAAPTSAGDPASPATPGTAHGGERILVVDDESDIVAMLARMLGARGYKVTSFTSGEDALAMFQCSPDDFDAVITDQTMPRLTGVDFARHIHAIRPNLPIILTTGYSDKTAMEPELSRAVRVATKPFDAGTLTTLLRRALDQTH